MENLIKELDLRISQLNNLKETTTFYNYFFGLQEWIFSASELKESKEILSEEFSEVNEEYSNRINKQKKRALDYWRRVKKVIIDNTEISLLKQDTKLSNDFENKDIKPVAYAQSVIDVVNKILSSEERVELLESAGLLYKYKNKDDFSGLKYDLSLDHDITNFRYTAEMYSKWVKTSPASNFFNLELEPTHWNGNWDGVKFLYADEDSTFRSNRDEIIYELYSLRDFIFDYYINRSYKRIVLSAEPLEIQKKIEISYSDGVIAFPNKGSIKFQINRESSFMGGSIIALFLKLLFSKIPYSLSFETVVNSNPQISKSQFYSYISYLNNKFKNSYQKGKTNFLLELKKEDNQPLSLKFILSCKAYKR